MLPNREYIIQRSIDLGLPDTQNTRTFLQAEEDAVQYTEYTANAIPTFAQTPDVAAAYMRTYANLSSEVIDLGLEVRQIRSKEAVHRLNILYVPADALRMDTMVTIDGTTKPLGISATARRAQLDKLAEVAQQDHIHLHLIPPGHDPLKNFEKASYMEPLVGENVVFLTFNEGPQPLTDSEARRPYEEGLELLAQVALSQSATISLIDELRS